ncbi:MULTISPECIES: O-methyltransferase [unclassified Sphingobium]|uniref:O-methyltransferase n=1 Tax=unclassified Sphingobium TaxID=2611147 RepID=UPI0009EB0F3B|nr:MULTISPECIES: O-methyltransferase [unclassified Sphingobium]
MTRKPDYPSADSDKWAAVDAYFSQLLAPADDALRAALTENEAAGLPAHDVSPLQGRMLALFAHMARARRILEIGTLGGYSTIWLARSLLPGSQIVTIERDEAHAAVARRNIDRAGLSALVDLRTGKALDVLPTLSGPFDLIFIDADKPNNPQYIRWALALSRVGTVIIGDNIVRGGGVLDPYSDDSNVQGVRSFLEILAAEPRVEATAIQTVGEKGWDGFALAVVRAEKRSEEIRHDRTILFRREEDGLIYRFAPAGMIEGRPIWRRTDRDLRLQWSRPMGWHVTDKAGAMLSRPWEVEKERQAGLPPEGIWVSRKGAKSYVYNLAWED